MNSGSIVLYEAEYSRVKAILSRAQGELRADLVLLIDRDGHQIASEGSARDIDLTSLASLASANLAATDGLPSWSGSLSSRCCTTKASIATSICRRFRTGFLSYWCLMNRLVGSG